MDIYVVFKNTSKEKWCELVEIINNEWYIPTESYIPIECKVNIWMYLIEFEHMEAIDYFVKNSPPVHDILFDFAHTHARFHKTKDFEMFKRLCGLGLKFHESHIRWITKQLATSNLKWLDFALENSLIETDEFLFELLVSYNHIPLFDKYLPKIDKSYIPKLIEISKSKGFVKMTRILDYELNNL